MLEACAASRLPLILSTGMATLSEIKESLSLLAHCYCHKSPIHSLANWEESFSSTVGQDLLNKYVTLLHCTTEYPCPMDQVDLLAMNHIRKEFGLPVGYSDHTEGINVSLAAAALGATVIEKHFTTDRTLAGPDHKASIDPKDFKKLVDGVREIEQALGKENKFVHSIESKNSAVARRSLTASKDISIGETFSEHNLTSKRPGTGISPMRFWDLLGKNASKAYKADDMIDSEEL
jgi:N-acetylneuraminate synthase